MNNIFVIDESQNTGEILQNNENSTSSNFSEKLLFS